MLLSLIVPTLNRPDDIKNLLISLEHQSRRPDELIVVDQSDGDLIANLVNDFREKNVISNVIYKFQKDKSSAKARNAGLDLARGDFISFLDDDIGLDSTYFEKSLQYFSDSTVGAVTGYCPGTFKNVGLKFCIRKILMRVFLLSNFKGRMTSSGFGYPIFKKEIKTVTQVDLFPGGSFTVRRELMARERFDDWFSGYSFREDVDLSYRLSRHAKLLMVPDAVYSHPDVESTRPSGVSYKIMQAKNYYYVFRKNKWRGPLSTILFWYSVIGLLVISFSEYIFSWKSEKWQTFLADIAAWKKVLAEGA